MSDHLTYLGTAYAQLPAGWKAGWRDAILLHRLAVIDQQLTAQKEQGVTIYPPAEQTFSALMLTPLENTRVIIMGQDPYHGVGQACGLAFAVHKEQRTPPSLRNIFKELVRDLSIPMPTHGHLSSWAQQGILLLNSTLTVIEGQAGSHRGLRWDVLTDALIRYLSEDGPSRIFVLWGNDARAKLPLIDQSKHLILTAAHPSPLSASRGFLGCSHFSQINQHLLAKGNIPICWGF